MTAARPDTWMPLYWGDYLRATGHLSTAEHGAYLLLIGHYWTSGQPLPDDDARLARVARMSPKEWRQARPALEDFFKIEEGSWSHSRIGKELSKATRITEAKSEAGKKGAQKRWQSDGKAMAEPPDSHKQTDTPSQPHTPVKKEEANASSKEKSSRRGSRLPDGWSPTAEQIFSLRDEGFTDDDHRREIPIFRDHFAAAPGQRGVKLDWFATYRNWCRKSREFRGRNQAPYAGKAGGQRPGGGSLVGAGLRRAAEICAVEDAERGGPRRGLDAGGNGHPAAVNGTRLVESQGDYRGPDGEGGGASGGRVLDGTFSEDRAAKNR